MASSTMTFLVSNYQKSNIQFLLEPLGEIYEMKSEEVFKITLKGISDFEIATTEETIQLHVQAVDGISICKSDGTLLRGD